MNNDSAEPSIAVCTKLSFSDRDPGRLVEWFEALRLFGVDKVFIHFYNISSRISEVFQHYKDIGLADTMEFGFIEKDVQDTLDTPLFWCDEQVALYTCQTRVLFYDYVLILDTDEFLVPTGNVVQNGWKTLVKNIFQNRTVAAARFTTANHITTFGPSDPVHDLYIRVYKNSTVPFLDRHKQIYMPTRIKLGSVWTHSMKPFAGYQSIQVDPKTAVIHHYRPCREEWLVPRPLYNPTKSNLPGEFFPWYLNTSDSHIFYLQRNILCHDFRLTPSEDIEKLANVIKENVSRTLAFLRDTRADV